MNGIVLTIVLALLIPGYLISQKKSVKPNILVFVADDLGYADVGFQGSKIPTPNLDKLANGGSILNRFYAAPICSPTRAGFITGNYPIRFGMMRAVVPPTRLYGLPEQQVTLAEALKENGYKYRGVVGKWHLGGRRQQWLPERHGFNYSVVCYNGAVDYFTQNRDGERDWHKNGKPFDITGYTTDLIESAAIDFLDQIPKEEPFFLYVPFTAPHTPFQPKEHDKLPFIKGNDNRKAYAAMTHGLDKSVGVILNKLKEENRFDNTLIIFFSDNGGVPGVADNGKFRGGKFKVYEGGIRTVAALQWKAGDIPKGPIDQPISYVDIFPTIMGIVGNSENYKTDGKNLYPALQSQRLENNEIFSYIDQNLNKKEELSLIQNDWKLVIIRSASDNESVFNTEELYNLSKDPSEKNNLIDEYPKIATGLKQKLQKYYDQKLKDQIPRYQDTEHFFENDIIPQWQPKY